MNKIRILVACGTGVATSTICAERIREICSDHGIDHIKIDQCTITEVSNRFHGVDIIVTTSNYANSDIDKPIINASSLITGINEEKVIKDLLQSIRTLKG